jgi:hypothetical protein
LSATERQQQLLGQTTFNGNTYQDLRMSQAKSALLNSIAALSTLIVTCATAADLTCAGTVDKLAFHAPGRLMIKLSSMNTPVFICSTDAVWTPAGSNGYSTTPEACRAIYATMLAARTTGATVNYIHFDGAEVPASCTGWGPWANANIRYFGL